MSNQPDYRKLFLKAQTSIGITKDNFHKKFIYSHEQPLDNYLLDRLTPTPSQLQGFTLEQEKNVAYLMSQMIFRSAESLKLPASTAIVAVSVAHYFFSRVGHLDYDFRDVAMGAMFLACKSQQTLRKSYEVSAVFDQIFKIFQGQKMPIKILVLNSTEYDYMRKKVLELENHILFQLGFEIYRLFDIPHRYIGSFFKSLQKHPESKKICQHAWTFLNDFYRTNCCIYYPGQVIAAASIYMALLKLKIKMPLVAWWVLMEANLESIEELIIELQSFYETSRLVKYSLENVGGFINEVGQKQGLTNVFAVNYYRKIMLDINNQLKIKKPVQVSIEVLLPEKLQPKVVQTKIELIQQTQQKDQIQSRSSSHKKKKDKKKKDKKRKKDKDKKERSKKRQRGNSSYSDHSRSRDKRYESSESKSVKIKRQADSREGPSLMKINNDSEKKPQSQQWEADLPKIQQKKIEAVEKLQKKQVVKQMQVESAKGLLSKISSQLSQLKKNEPKKLQPQKESSEDEDQQMLAALIKIKKSNAEKKVKP